MIANRTRLNTNHEVKFSNLVKHYWQEKKIYEKNKIPSAEKTPMNCKSQNPIHKTQSFEII